MATELPRDPWKVNVPGVENFKQNLIFTEFKESLKKEKTMMCLLKNITHRSGPLSIFLILLLCGLISCETVQKSSQPKPQKPKALNQTPRQDKEKKPDEFVVFTKKTDLEAQNVQKKDLKSAGKAEFRVEAPVHVQKRVGGKRNYYGDVRSRGDKTELL